MVVEDLGFEPDGEGEHLLVKSSKRLQYPFVADALAKFLKIHSREVSFAGQKDKHAVRNSGYALACQARKCPI
ncbi:hypothetical protein ACNKHX_16715 [Shigella flexneri]